MGFLLVTYRMDMDTHLDQGDGVILLGGGNELLVLRLVTVLGSGHRKAPGIENTGPNCLGTALRKKQFYRLC